MIVTHNVTIDLLDRGSIPRIDAMQDDRYTRELAISLMTGTEPWIIPEDAAAVIRYCKSDGIGGEYDTLPDGTGAWSASGNVLTLALAPQVLTVPGTVVLSASLIRENQLLGIYSVHIHVWEQAKRNVGESQDYYKVMGFLPGPLNAKAGQFLRVAQVDDEGNVVVVEGADAVPGGSGEAADDAIRTLTISYGLSATDALPPKNWSETVPQMSAEYPYLWIKLEKKYSNAVAVADVGVIGYYGSGKPEAMAEPGEEDIPRVFFGGALQQTKDEKVVPFRYVSKTGEFSGYAQIKAQGNSSMNYPKKNQTVKMFKDAECTEKMKVDFKGWGDQNKHVYKANWIDLSHARNVVSARLWADVVKSRADYESLPELLKTSPNLGAVDGFPVKVYADGIYQGRYTLNIPKDKWMFNMDDSLDSHCVLCGENYASGCFRASANINGNDWSDEIHDTVPASVKTRWNEVISFVMNATDEEFKANLGSYFYVDSLIDYYLFGLASCGLDAFGKNQIYATYDGQKWIASMYDMDSTWGLYWDGSKLVASDYARTAYEDYVSANASGEGNLLYNRLEQLFRGELQSRWTELKNGALSIANIINRFERFTDIAPQELVKEDYASSTGGGAFTGIPSQTTNNIQQIRAFALARLAWTDEYVLGTVGGEDSPVYSTGIQLTPSELVFTGEDSQTLTATVYPEGCTDAVVWESSAPVVASVTAEGNSCTVRSVGNGEAVITATCGSHSASCSVSVSGIGTETGELVYSLPQATTFDGTGCIDTGIALFAEDEPFTVLIDWTHTNNAFAGQSGTVAHCMKEITSWVGLVVQYSDFAMQMEVNQTNKLTVLAGVNSGTATSDPGIFYDGIANKDFANMKAAFTKNASGQVKISRRYNNSGEILTSSVDCTFVSIPQTLLLGGYQTSNGTKGRYAKGILEDCKVYNYALPDAEIEAFLNA